MIHMQLAPLEVKKNTSRGKGTWNKDGKAANEGDRIKPATSEGNWSLIEPKNSWSQCKRIVQIDFPT